MIDKKPGTYDVDAMTQAQLEIYARELQLLFQEERRLRLEIEEKNKELERRLTELAALNEVFQRYRQERSLVSDSLKTLVGILECISSFDRTGVDAIEEGGQTLSLDVQRAGRGAHYWGR